jgi:hypothetical protein
MNKIEILLKGYCNIDKYKKNYQTNENIDFGKIINTFIENIVNNNNVEESKDNIIYIIDEILGKNIIHDYQYKFITNIYTKIVDELIKNDNDNNILLLFIMVKLIDKLFIFKNNTEYSNENRKKIIDELDGLLNKNGNKNYVLLYNYFKYYIDDNPKNNSTIKTNEEIKQILTEFFKKIICYSNTVNKQVKCYEVKNFFDKIIKNKITINKNLMQNILNDIKGINDIKDINYVNTFYNKYKEQIDNYAKTLVKNLNESNKSKILISVPNKNKLSKNNMEKFNNLLIFKDGINDIINSNPENKEYLNKCKKIKLFLDSVPELSNKNKLINSKLINYILNNITKNLPIDVNNFYTTFEIIIEQNYKNYKFHILNEILKKINLLYEKINAKIVMIKIKTYINMLIKNLDNKSMDNIIDNIIINYNINPETYINNFYKNQLLNIKIFIKNVLNIIKKNFVDFYRKKIEIESQNKNKSEILDIIQKENTKVKNFIEILINYSDKTQNRKDIKLEEIIKNILNNYDEQDNNYDEQDNNYDEQDNQSFMENFYKIYENYLVPTSSVPTSSVPTSSVSTEELKHVPNKKPNNSHMKGSNIKIPKENIKNMIQNANFDIPVFKLFEKSKGYPFQIY